MAVPVRTDPAFSCESPKSLFRGTYVSANYTLGTLDLSPWDISPDGKRFLMIKEAGSGTGGGLRKINIVLNWFEELKQLVLVKWFEIITPSQGGRHESICDCHRNFSAPCFSGASVPPDFSGASNDQHFRCTDVDERGGLHRDSRFGNLAVDG
jgi:hypothetical protein